MCILGTPLYFLKDFILLFFQITLWILHGISLDILAITGPETTLHKEGTEVGFGLCLCTCMCSSHTHISVLLKCEDVTLPVFSWLFLSSWERDVQSIRQKHRQMTKDLMRKMYGKPWGKPFCPHWRSQRICDMGTRTGLGIGWKTRQTMIIKEVER